MIIVVIIIIIIIFIDCCQMSGRGNSADESSSDGDQRQQLDEDLRGQQNPLPRRISFTTATADYDASSTRVGLVASLKCVAAGIS